MYPKFTDSAIKYLGDKIKEDELLCLGVSGGGCSGFSYSIKIEKKQNGVKKFHSLFRVGNFYVLADNKSMIFLKDCTVNYEPGLKIGKQFGLSIQNAAAVSTCGCGLSFSI